MGTGPVEALSVVAVVAEDLVVVAREAVALQPGVHRCARRQPVPATVLGALSVDVVDGEELRDRLAAANAGPTVSRQDFLAKSETLLFLLRGQAETVTGSPLRHVDLVRHHFAP